VTTVHIGNAKNVISDSCELTGTLRTFSIELMELMQRRMREIVQHTCSAFGMESDIEFTKGYPATVNHQLETALSREVMRAIVGDHGIVEQPKVMGSEDFAFMLQ